MWLFSSRLVKNTAGPYKGVIGLPLVLIPNFVSPQLTHKESTLILEGKQQNFENWIY